MRIQVDQIDVHYLIEGSERPDQEVVVLLHGWGANVTPVSYTHLTLPTIYSV